MTKRLFESILLNSCYGQHVDIITQFYWQTSFRYRRMKYLINLDCHFNFSLTHISTENDISHALNVVTSSSFIMAWCSYTERGQNYDISLSYHDILHTFWCRILTKRPQKYDDFLFLNAQCFKSNHLCKYFSFHVCKASLPDIFW